MFPPGRGRLVRRGTAARIVQVAHFAAAPTTRPVRADAAGQTTVLDPATAVDPTTVLDPEGAVDAP
ncbi:hypothetical protein Csp2054_03345 [Curtobacterium sp. 'Ferrero']|uniref:hypothetical protein n=1 Tax=Curtobacterium sp. 'Ferrero' TaxID=2033654 RepID=UPI000BC3E288|nr:hypothetical protein [Curtobacterium sp. 'Ferrero']PCN49229.1 hypothetical protein Csp2054_03345 [Curtobacterium sp. 'Ferrero']